jgi:restriction endonuclease S subunit
MTHDAPFYVALAEVAEIAAGFPLRGSTEALTDGVTPFIQMKNVDPETGIRWDEVPYVELPSVRSPKWLSERDIIFASRGTRNYAYAVAGGPKHSACSPHFFVVSPKKSNRLLPEFLAWQINQKPAQDYFQRSAVGTQAIMTIRRPALEALPIVVPPVREQELILEFWRASKKERAALHRLIQLSTKQSEAIAIGLFKQFKGTHS